MVAYWGDRTWSHEAGDEWNLIQWKSEREIIQEPARGWGKEQRNEGWGRVAGETYEPGSVDCDDQGVVGGGEDVEEEWEGGEFSSEDEDAILDSSHAGELSALKMLAKELWRSLFLIDELTGKFPEVNVYIDSEALYACLRSGKVTKEPQLQPELDYVIQTFRKMGMDPSKNVVWTPRKLNRADWMTKPVWREK
uniref:Uncharacterized protein n=1 Tax=Chromera velia CCMP2878 TaxID=1169474 RepID=A0A0G4HWM3_9ALVE|eukprot:Cvel_9076.t1-p1 / transcript=Cvel_9076.t1 / gene=Cvel_9076 / organism=Chromera_velia_CCMP2878 / gene_product=hypothetical protein / transcript_product=hypothetical protein / location=Cvel_scaffold515:13075-13653(-) / protein_length=193 / sequence_SO=supercontig / SO=protein_coding / is_pseudo=false